MKIDSKKILSLAAALFFTAAAFPAESGAANTFSDAGRHSLAASGEAVTAVGSSIVGSTQIVASAAAVPVWMSGAVATGSGQVLNASGEVAGRVGSAVTRGAEKLWDFATGDVASRPPMARERAVPPAPVARRKPQDPSPAEALRSKPDAPVIPTRAATLNAGY